MASEIDENTADNVGGGWATEEIPMEDNGANQLVTIDVPEVKLFGKWSLNEVEVSDISLVVSYTYKHRVYKSNFLLPIFAN